MSETSTILLNLDPLLNDPASEDYLGLAHGTLKQWRRRGQFSELLTPTYLGVKVAYRRSCLEAFISARTSGGNGFARQRKSASV